MTWILANWETLLLLWGAVSALGVNVVAAARVFVMLTPSKTDNEVLEKIVKVAKKIGLHVD